MFQPKKDKWLLPSFDFTPARTPLKLKRAATMPIKTAESPMKKAFTKRYSSDNLIRKDNINNLSHLLSACNPKNSTELAISRQKQQEISAWLKSKTQKGKPHILVISGPSGCGKTVALKIIAEEHNFDVTEWITPIDQIINEDNKIMRQGDKFEEFLIRATRYNSVLNDSSRRLLLVKELPNVFIDDNDGFNIVLEKYIQFGREPLVFVHTEFGNSRLMQTLFATSVRERFGIDVINVNATTQVAMKKILERVSKILHAKADHFLKITQDKIFEVLSNQIGDVRSTILNLIFSSLKVPVSFTKSECEGREETLTLLHGVGRVINPKRIGEGKTFKFNHDPDDIAAFFQSQATNFVHFLHENYLNTLREISRAELSADVLSLADVLTSEWRDSNLNKVTLSFCVRGLMVANDNPVGGWNPVKKPQNSSMKTDRNLALAEVQCYKSLIRPDSKKSEETENSNMLENEELIIDNTD